MGNYRGRHYPDEEPLDEGLEENRELSHMGAPPPVSGQLVSDALPADVVTPPGGPFVFAPPPAPVAPDERIDPVPDIPSDSIVGPFDAWLGEVQQIHLSDDASMTETGYSQEILVTRIGVDFQTNNEPAAVDVPPAFSNQTPAPIAALPWPLRHDQQDYIVAKGDIVTVLTGRDGRAYYMVDDAPFVAQVMSHVDTDYEVTTRQNSPPTGPSPGDAYIVLVGTGDWAGQDDDVATWDGAAWGFDTPSNPSFAYASSTDNFWKFTSSWATTTDVTEANAGGAGNKTLRVIRKVLAGAPGSLDVLALSDLQDASSVDIEYEHVNVIVPAHSAHGYRTGDMVWVHKRGRYFFCHGLPKTFVAEIQTAGPDGEADLTTNHYWFKEQTPTIAYSTNQWTVTWAAVTQTDPTGSGGRYGRWGDAVNVAEGAALHALANGTLVLVTEVADPATKEIGYVIERAPISTTGLTPGGIIYPTPEGLIVSTPTPSDGDIPQYESGTNAWETKSVAELIGYSRSFTHIIKVAATTAAGKTTIAVGPFNASMFEFRVFGFLSGGATANNDWKPYINAIGGAITAHYEAGALPSPLTLAVDIGDATGLDLIVDTDGDMKWEYTQDNANNRWGYLSMATRTAVPDASV